MTTPRARSWNYGAIEAQLLRMVVGQDDVLRGKRVQRIDARHWSVSGSRPVLLGRAIDLVMVLARSSGDVEEQQAPG
jgi:hypothetical protein